MSEATITVTQADRDRAAAFEEAAMIAEAYNIGTERDERDNARNATAKLIAASIRDAIPAGLATSDLTAAAQLERSGLITREKYNHIVENIRARAAIRECME